jgi:hypothetical protein
VNNQREYNLPAAASLDLRQVYLLTDSTTGSRKPVPVLNWEIEKTATGTEDKLVLAYDLPGGYNLWLRYAKQHAELRDADDELDPAIHPDRLVAVAAAELLREFRDRTRLRHLDSTIEYLDGKAQRMVDRHPLPTIPQKQRKVMRISRTLKMGA